MPTPEERRLAKIRRCLRCGATKLGRDFEKWSQVCLECFPPVVVGRGEKRCSKCGDVKKLASFRISLRNRKRRAARCVSCTSLGTKVCMRKRRAQETPAQRRRRLWLRAMKKRVNKYGVELESLKTRVAAGCELCGKPFRTRFEIAVDHCHTTGATRGVLHSRCNVLIGMCGESVAILRDAIKYLRKHKKGGQ